MAASLSYFDEWANDPANPINERAAPDNLAAHREAIGQVETGGNYSAIGPRHAKYGRPLGKYQIMETNLPEWSQAALGRVVSPGEFLKSEKIQDAIFNHKFGQYLAEGTPQDAASKWFTGQPLAQGAAKSDVLGTTGQSYVDRYMANLKGAQKAPVGKVDDAGDLLTKDIEFFARKHFPRAYEEGVAAPRAPEVPTLTPTPPQPSAPAAAWGPVENILNAATLGQGPALSVGPVRGQQMWDAIAAAAASGKSPEEIQAAARKAFVPAEEVTQDVAAARDAWQKANPGANLATELVGQVAPIATGIGAGNALIGAGARALGGVAPKAAPAVANFLMGTGGPAGGGLGGFAARRASDIAAGAWQGALGNALTGQDIGQGATFGGATGGALGAPLRALTSPLRAQMLPEVARAAQNYGAELPIGSLISGPAGKTVQALAGVGDRQAVEQFTQKMLQHAGAEKVAEAEGVRGLTAEVFKNTKAELSDAYNNLAAKSAAWIGPDTKNELLQIFRDAKFDLGKTREDAVKTLGESIRGIIKSTRSDPAGGQWLHGNDFLSVVKPGGFLDAIYEADNRLTPYADRVKKLLFDAYEKTSPEAYDELKSLDSKWNTLRNLKNLVPEGEHGLLNPVKVAKKFAGQVGDVADTAGIGAFLPPVDAAGNVTKKAPGLIDKVRGYLPHGVGPASAIGIGALAAEHAGPILTQALAHPTEGALALGGLASAGLARHAYGNFLQSPAFAQQVIQNTLNPAATHYLVNPLTFVSPQWSGQK